MEEVLEAYRLYGGVVLKCSLCHRDGLEYIRRADVMHEYEATVVLVEIVFIHMRNLAVAYLGCLVIGIIGAEYVAPVEHAVACEQRHVVLAEVGVAFVAVDGIGVRTVHQHGEVTVGDAEIDGVIVGLGVRRYHVGVWCPVGVGLVFVHQVGRNADIHELVFVEHLLRRYHLRGLEIGDVV